ANEELTTLWLQLGQKQLPSYRHACALATAHKSLPQSLLTSGLCGLWMEQLEALACQDGPLTCRPSDIEQAVQLLVKMSSDDAVLLIQHVMALCDEQLQPEEYLEM
ncbi:GIP, partial [Symbiodinium sp. CCMP2456]